MGDDGIYLPRFSKEEAIKACEESNATLPYCNYKAQKRQTKLNFNLAFNHFKIIKENFLLNHGQAEFRGANFFPVEIFLKSNRDSDSVKNSESHDIKFLT